MSSNKKEDVAVADGTAVIKDDPYLEPYLQTLKNRFSTFKWWKDEIANKEKSMAQFAKGYENFGLHVTEKGIVCFEWAPGAHSMHLVGDFNDWNRTSHPFARTEFGCWSLFIPNNPDGTPRLKHLSKVKILINGNHFTISPWIRYTIQEKDNPTFDGVFWNPPTAFKFTHPRPEKPKCLKIYECHVGMATKEENIGSYKEFTSNILPYVSSMGYNCIQMMAIMEHPYYASFGYQVSSFFAPSSRFGTPDDLKALIDEAHRLGLYVLLDLVHSHASINSSDGLNMFDGTDGCYFHSGSRGIHELWGSRLFNYSEWEVLRFLLSNLRWWIEQYQFDGFRFDGVTSMLLTNNAIGEIPQDYDGYFGAQIDGDALRYLTLANDMLHELFPFIITVAEDASGFACLCRPTSEGGVGFDYRLQMGLPDLWKKMMKVKDEDWNMGKLTFEISNRRWKEKNISYVESHDQALVGDKTMAFWLMDKDMYTGMSILQPYTPVIDRGIQLHKMIRLLTFGLGGEGYLTFMGNEFGHPEWIDFPREGNNDSYHHCRRRWDLPEDHLLRYQHLRDFEKAMLKLEIDYPWMCSGNYVSLAHEGDKVIVFERGSLVFAFNFHPQKSFSDYQIGVANPGEYKILLDSDLKQFGGHKRIDDSTSFFTSQTPFNDRPHSMKMYLPSRCCLVFGIVSPKE